MMDAAFCNFVQNDTRSMTRMMLVCIRFNACLIYPMNDFYGPLFYF